MARKRTRRPSKSELIRKLSVENPGMGPTEIAHLIHTSHRVKVSPAMVSTVLSQDRSRGSTPARRGRPPKPVSGVAGKSKAAHGLSIEDLLKAKQFAADMGGIEEAKKALETLSKILA